MQSQIQTLKDSPLTQVLADGFAMLYHERPEFPVTYLAHYMKNRLHSKEQLQGISAKVAHIKELTSKMAKEEAAKQKEAESQQESGKRDKQQKQFVSFLEKAEYHEDILDDFCDWIQKRFAFTGAYIGELLSKKKKIDLQAEDSEEAHIDLEAPKAIKFEHSSASHKDILLNEWVSLDSVVGRLMSGSPEAEGEGEAAEGEEKEEGKEVKPKDQIYVPSVVEKKDLHFFKYPRLGAFYAISFKIKSYLSEKLLESNIAKTQTYEKALQDFEREHDEREAKFREAYDEKTAQGVDQQELEQMEKDFETENAQFPKPELEPFEFIERSFVLGLDTLGQDRGITEEDQSRIREFVSTLKTAWENTELAALKADIARHLKLDEKIEGSPLEAYNKLIEEEDRELPGVEEVEKFKDNEKLFELEMDTMRVQRLKEYLADEKYEPFVEEILKAKVLKFKEILKYWLLFTGLSKQDICYPVANVLDLRKAKKFLKRESFVEKIQNYPLRGSKPDGDVQDAAKWERIARNLQTIDTQLVVSSNIYLAFLLRFLQLAAKVRVADRERRVQVMKEERKSRRQRQKQNDQKNKERLSKLNAAKAEFEEREDKEEDEKFNEEAWQAQYNEAEENQLLDVGPEIVDEIDRDLENGEEIFPDVAEEEPAEAAEPE